MRFWAKSGFFPFLTRDENNIRRFSENDMQWIRIVKCLRSVGTQNKDIKRYIDLCVEGDSTIRERYEIILNTKAKALKQLDELKKQIDVLNYKEDFYKNLMNGKMEDIWNPMKTKTAIAGNKT